MLTGEREIDRSNASYLPPHLLAYPVRAATEALGRYSKIVCLVLERVETLATLRDRVDVVTHDTDGSKGE